MAKLALAQEVEEREERKRVARQNRMEMTVANRDAIRMKEEQLAREAAEDAKIKAHAAEKERITMMRKAHLKKKHEEKQEEIQKMITKAVSHLSKMKNTEDARLERAVQQREIKEEEGRLRKIERQRQEMEAIDKSRQNQLARKRELALAEKAADNQMAAEWLAHNRKMIAKETEKEQMISQRKRDNSRSLAKMAKTVKAQKLAKRQATKNYYNAKFAADAKKREEYDNYVKDEIRKYAKSGKNVKALAHALKPQTDLMSAF